MSDLRANEGSAAGVPLAGHPAALMTLEPSSAKHMLLSAMRQTVATGSAAIAAAEATLRVVEQDLRSVRAVIAARSVLPDTLSALPNRLRQRAAAAAVGTVNLLVIDRDATDECVFSLGSALVRSASGAIAIRSIEVDRAFIALFDDRSPEGSRRGILDRIENGAGTSLTGLATQPDESAVALIDTAVGRIKAALSHLSVARSRIALQSSFIASLAGTLADGAEAVIVPDLAMPDLRVAALAVRRLLGAQGLSIANAAGVETLGRDA